MPKPTANPVAEVKGSPLTPSPPITTSDVTALVAAMGRMTSLIGCMSNKPLLNDEEAAAWLGFKGDNPRAYMVWLRANTELKSVKLNKNRRWRRRDLEALIESLPEIEAKPRKPRLRKSA
jgi:hypothetical protein